MRQIFSNADFTIAWLGIESDCSVEVMQAISDYEPDMTPVPLSFGKPPLPRHLGNMLNIFGGLTYWSRLWIVQEIILANDILVVWGNELLPWYKIINIGIRCSARVPIRIASLEHACQHTNDYDENWVKLVLEKERREIFLGDPGKADGDIHRAMQPASLYALIVQFAGHGCLVPRDKVIGLLGLIPDDAAYLIDYSTPIEEYFREVCKYVFITAPIRGDLTKAQFQRLLGESLGISASEYSVLISNP